MDMQNENALVLNLVQAMIGSITPNFRAVFIASESIEVRLHFLLEYESSEDRNEIDDIVFEFEALQSSRVDIELVVSVDTRALDELRIPGRLVYARKETIQRFSV